MAARGERSQMRSDASSSLPCPDDSVRSPIVKVEALLSLLLRRSVQTYALWMIWLLEALNYVVHVVARPVPWNTTSTLIGYALWALQLACFTRCQLTEPGSLPLDWKEQAQEGTEGATVCKRSGLLLPPRAMYVRRAGK